MQPVRRLRLEPAFHEVGPAARALRRFGGDGRPAAAHAADSRFPHDVHHLVAADLGRIPAPRQQLGVRLAVPVHGHEEIGMDLEDVAGQRLVPGGHAADGPGSEHAVAARRDGPAVQRSGQHPADRPDPETVLEFVDVSDHQRRVGSSRAAKKADAVVNISFARLNRATSARKLLNSAIASSADCLVSAATVASVLLRQRRSVSGATPRSLATCSIALVSDEYEPRDSVDSLTAFALNSGVYLVPFAMVPSSPIELGEMRNKNQFISVWFQMEGGGAEFNLWTGRAWRRPRSADRRSERNSICGLEERVDPAMQQMVDNAMDSSSGYGQQLSEAWHYMFGREPNYSAAYAAAIKAVESIALPMVEPNNKDSTLSKASRVMRDQHWEFQIEAREENNVPGGVIQLLMSGLMNSQPDRHGGPDSGVVSKEKAQAAVYSAVFLIQCFKAGLVRRPAI